MNGKRLTENERKELSKAIARLGGVPPVAKRLGMSPQTLVRLYSGLSCSAGTLALYRINYEALGDNKT